jgi:ribonuclease T1
MKSTFLLLFSAFFLLISCGNNLNNNEHKNARSGENKSNNSKENTDYQSNTSIPKKVYDVLKYVRANGKAMQGYVGGRTFQNREKRLSLTDEKGRKIRYQEWDVNPKEQGRNRGAERLITSDTKAFYTNDHYKTFQEVE